MTTGQPAPIPSEPDAARVVEAVLGVGVTEARRFPAGLAHYVFDVRTEDGRVLVARLTRPDLRRRYDGSLYWHRRLRPLGVPLPELLFADDGARFGFPVLLLERLPGSDLGEVYGGLSDEQKRALAARIVGIQAAVATLPRARGFGYALAHDDPSLHPSWPDVLGAELARSRRRLTAAGLLDPSLVDGVEALVAAHDGYLARVEPTAFLDDLTTKNVIVADGRLSGIVDVDVVCFGDALLTPALTRVALASLGRDAAYVEHWLGLLSLTPDRRRAFEIYVALFCVGLLSEIGHRFNRAEPVAADEARVGRLLDLLRRIEPV